MRRRALARAVLGAWMGLILGVMASAQELRAPSAVLTIDPEQLFEQTAFGKRIIAESEALAAAPQAENRQIEAELTEEERDLTEQRPSLSVDEFRALADAFDEKVNRIRTEQDTKGREVQSFREREQQRFFGVIGPVLLGVVRERNAAVILDRRSVFLSTETVDVTQDAIARIDAQFGDGARAGTDQE